MDELTRIDVKASLALMHWTNYMEREQDKANLITFLTFLLLATQQVAYLTR